MCARFGTSYNIRSRALFRAALLAQRLFWCPMGSLGCSLSGRKAAPAPACQLPLVHSLIPNRLSQVSEQFELKCGSVSNTNLELPN